MRSWLGDQRLGHIRRWQIRSGKKNDDFDLFRKERKLYGTPTRCGNNGDLQCGLLVFIGGKSQQDKSASSNFDGIVTEVCDQHVSMLAADGAPQVISSDRHTVKPWFQGKLPFSFNLPENLPTDTRLEWANLTYLYSEPAALLLYSVGKHRVSVSP